MRRNKDEDIKQKKTESLLLEIISEGFSNLNDPKLKGLVVTRVEISRGKYDAHIFLSDQLIAVDEQKKILKQLKRAGSFLREYCLQATNWFRCPKFHFEFDKQLNHEQHLNKLFDQIEKDRKTAQNSQHEEQN